MRIHNRILLAVNLLLACGVTFSAPQWAWEAGKQSSNGAVTLKSTGNGSTTYTGTQNPTGANVKVNQNAVTQPPTIIVQATGGSALSIQTPGTACTQTTSGASPNQTADEGLAITSDRNKLLSCIAGVWGGTPVVPPNGCYVGMPLTSPMPCEIGAHIYASSSDGTVIGKYAGLSQSDYSPFIVSLDGSSVFKNYSYGCYGIVPGLIGSDSYYDGFSNTAKILAHCPTHVNAASYCKTLGPDWYVPAIHQLAVLYERRDLLGNFRTGSSDRYWASTEKNETQALMLNFGLGSWQNFTNGKSYANIVRCVRSF